MVHRIYISISDFLKRFRINVATVIDGRHEIAQPVYDEEGRGSVEHVGERKTAVAKVKVTKPGSGEFVIRHVDYMDIENDITYFFECVYVSKLYIIIIITRCYAGLRPASSLGLRLPNKLGVFATDT